MATPRMQTMPFNWNSAGRLQDRTLCAANLAWLLFCDGGMQSTHRHQLAPNLPVTRRAVLGLLGSAGAALLTGCTPLRLALRMYPGDEQMLRGVSTLATFVLTVIPGLKDDERTVTRVFYDERYPLARFRRFLVFDLDRRADSRNPGWAFADLDLASRTRVLSDVLERGGVTARLYGGAIFLAQVAVYGSIYDDDRGCPLIDYHGCEGVLPLALQSYPDPGTFLAAPCTADGNYA